MNTINIDGKKVGSYTISNKKGMLAELTNYGTKIVRLLVPDKNNQLDDVVLGFDSLQETLDREPYFGATCGRFANRIKNGRFTIDGKEYQLPQNNGNNCLHGGVEGFNAKVWDVLEHTENSIRMYYQSVDGEEGFPGNLDCYVKFTITEENELRIDYEARTDKPTVIGLTNHSYFNLKGVGNGSIRDHHLKINADFHTVLDDEMCPTGEVKPVDNSPFDLRKAVLVDDVIDAAEYTAAGGLDNNWVINKKEKSELVLAAVLSEEKSGRRMEVFTTQPGMQIYTSNGLAKQNIKGGKTTDEHESICLEAQNFPNSPNIGHFPSSVLRPGELYKELTIYKFLTF